MSYRDFINIKVNTSQESFLCGENIFEEIIIKNNSEETIFIDAIYINLNIKHQGKGETDTKRIESLIIRDYKDIKPRSTIIHQIKFKPVYNVSFVGKNLTQNIVIHTKVDINKESEKKLRSLVLNDFKIGSYISGKFKPDFYNETLILVKKGDINYTIKKAKGNIKPGLNNSLKLIGTVFFILTILNFILYSNFKIIEIIYTSLVLFMAFLLILYLLKIAPSFKIGKINYELSNLEGNFYDAKLTIENRNHNLEEVSFQLIAKEKVTYDNGSSRSTSISTFYKSKMKTVKRMGNSINEIIELPTKSLPISIYNNDFEIIWFLKIIVVTKNNNKLKGTSKIELDLER